MSKVKAIMASVYYVFAGTRHDGALSVEPGNANSATITFRTAPTKRGGKREEHALNPSLAAKVASGPAPEGSDWPYRAGSVNGWRCWRLAEGIKIGETRFQAGQPIADLRSAIGIQVQEKPRHQIAETPSTPAPRNKRGAKVEPPAPEGKRGRRAVSSAPAPVATRRRVAPAVKR